jgi:hypothetical protein
MSVGSYRIIEQFVRPGNCAETHQSDLALPHDRFVSFCGILSDLCFGERENGFGGSEDSGVILDQPSMLDSPLRISFGIVVTERSKSAKSGALLWRRTKDLKMEFSFYFGFPDRSDFSKSSA